MEGAGSGWETSGSGSGGGGDEGVAVKKDDSSCGLYDALRLEGVWAKS